MNYGKMNPFQKMAKGAGMKGGSASSRKGNGGSKGGAKGGGKGGAKSGGKKGGYR